MKGCAFGLKVVDAVVVDVVDAAVVVVVVVVLRTRIASTILHATE